MAGVDPELTQAGGRPSPKPDDETLPPPKLPKRRRLFVAHPVAVLALAVGGSAGYLLEPLSRSDDATVVDETGSLEVTVPSDWEDAVGDEQWTPPTDGDGDYPALSVGTSPAWTDPEAGRPRACSWGCSPATTCRASCPSTPSARTRPTRSPSPATTPR